MTPAISSGIPIQQLSSASQGPKKGAFKAPAVVAQVVFSGSSVGGKGAARKFTPIVVPVVLSKPENTPPSSRNGSAPPLLPVGSTLPLRRSISATPTHQQEKTGRLVRSSSQTFNRITPVPFSPKGAGEKGLTSPPLSNFTHEMVYPLTLLEEEEPASSSSKQPDVKAEAAPASQASPPRSFSSYQTCRFLPMRRTLRSLYEDLVDSEGQANMYAEVLRAQMISNEAIFPWNESGSAVPRGLSIKLLRERYLSSRKDGLAHSKGEENVYVEALRTLVVSNEAVFQWNEKERAVPRDLSTKPLREVYLPKEPTKEFAATGGIEDDSYFTLIDATNDFWGIGMRARVAIKSIPSSGKEAATQELSPLAGGDLENGDTLTAFKFSSNAGKFFVGTSSGQILSGDVQRKKAVTSYGIRRGSLPVNSIAIQGDRVFFGGESATLLSIDIRAPSSLVENTYCFDAAHKICKILAHTERDVIVVGTDAGAIHFFDVRKLVAPYQALQEHKAAVKALSFINGSYLASGGGTADRTVKIWNLTTSQKVNERQMEGQITGIGYSNKTLIVTHGYLQEGTTFLSLPGAQVPLEPTQMAFDPSPGGRVLDLAVSPDESALFTISADERIKYYAMKPKKKAQGLPMGLSATVR